MGNELGDGGSSGYRSSSSPSIHSEENLYENHVVGSVVGSLEELSIKDMQEEEPVRHDVAIETTQTLERQQGRDGRRESGVCLEFEEFEPDDYNERRQIRQKKEWKEVETKRKSKEEKKNNEVIYSKPKKDEKRLQLEKKDQSDVHKHHHRSHH